MNNLNFIGNIGQDAVVRFTQAGKAVTSFSAAMSSGWGDRKVTTWVNCTIWGERGQKLAPYLLKGQKVGVNGEASLREWESNGKSGTSFECNVQDVTLCGEKPAASQQPAAASHQPAQAKQAAEPDTFHDDQIPF